MKTVLKFSIFLLLLNIGFLKGQQGDTVRLCVYNLQTYGAQENGERNPSIIKVLNAINPDVFVLQGILKDSTQQLLHQIVENLSSTDYSSVLQEFTQPSVEYRESHIYFKASKFRWLESTSFTANRHENLLCRLYHQTTGDTFNIFAIDLHPRSPVEREMQIADITGPLRTQYAYFLKTAIIGAMYFYSPEESAYFRLTARHNNAPWFLELTDPFGKEWQENTSEFSYMYTNSTRSNEVGCDTALGNGLKYRYDYILNRRELLENYIPNSYTVFGNDGLDRRNSSITDPPNQKVSQKIAEALQCASSHLPVYADYVFGKVTSVENLPLSELSLSFYPNPLQESSTISCSLPADGVLKITLHDMLGREVTILHDAFKSAGNYTFPFKNENLPDGMYVLKISAGGRSLTRSVSIVR
ncbi:MAG: T9SS type A sorting domain-containing protein [Bacteroidota bacterium]